MVFLFTEGTNENQQGADYYYNWKIKGCQGWISFNFNKVKGRVVFNLIFLEVLEIIPSEAESWEYSKIIWGLQGTKIDFYIITNEEREPVAKIYGGSWLYFSCYLFHSKGIPMPVDGFQTARSYLLD